MLKNTPIYQTLSNARMLSEVDAWMKSIDIDVKKDIIRFIQDDQLTQKGIDGDGDVIGLYSRATEMMTNGRKREGDRYNLNDTGAFYRSMYVRAMIDSIFIDANPIKDKDNLFLKYGENIIMLTDENLQIISQKIKQKIIDYTINFLSQRSK